MIKDIKVRVFLIGGVSGLTADAELNFRILRNIGLLIVPILTEKDLSKVKIGNSTVVVDALFGIGLNRELYGIHKEVIEFMNVTKAPVVSIDVPSGFNANTGDDWGTCVKAKKTITFTFPKKGFYQKRAKGVIGEIITVDIGAFKKKLKLKE